MKVKVSELQGAALDWAVAKCKGLKVRVMKANDYYTDIYMEGEVT